MGNGKQPVPERADGAAEDKARLIRRHRVFGWWSLLVFLSLGVLLEALHGFKIGWYLDVDNGTRRLLFRLAHTHGTLFALVHLAFSEGLHRITAPVTGWARTASACLVAATICMPGGFFLGGFFLHGGDPGYGVVLAPVGGIVMVVGVFLIARGFTRDRGGNPVL